jgi:hypothetical protein
MGAVASKESQMFKRVLLAFTFVAALGEAGLGMGSKAMAWHCNDYGYGYRTYYPSYYSYDYGPSVSYYRSYPTYYGHYDRGHHHHHHHHGHHGHHHGGLRVSFGF